MLDDPESFKTKEESKKSVLDYILQPQLYPDLYEDLCHVVRINYYPPRGDNKEGWDNIDLVGWLGYTMQLKINFLCRDSILAAPIVLDVALFLDLAKRAGMHGIQEWLSFYFKSPHARAGPLSGARPVHPADEAEEHAALSAGRGADHAPRTGVLRLMDSDRLQPALSGGLLIGVLSALPLVNVGNCCCCMWVIAGGMLAVYLRQQNTPFAVSSSEGALVGLMAGADRRHHRGHPVDPNRVDDGPLPAPVHRVGAVGEPRHPERIPPDDRARRHGSRRLSPSG